MLHGDLIFASLLPQSYLKEGLLLLFFAATGSGFEYFGKPGFGGAQRAVVAHDLTLRPLTQEADSRILPLRVASNDLQRCEFIQQWLSVNTKRSRFSRQLIL